MDPVPHSEMRDDVSNKGSQDALNKGKKTNAVLTIHSMENRDALYPCTTIIVKDK